MELNAKTGSIITKERAKELISSFQNQYKDEINSSFIGADNVKHILSQESCMGIRIYNGFDVKNQKISLVLVGVDENGEELLHDGIIYDDLKICPPVCPLEGSLLYL